MDDTKKVSRVKFEGRVVKDPKTGLSRSGNKPYFNAQAVKDEDDGSVTWVTLVAFGAFAENLATKLKKGSLFQAKGRLEVKEFTKKDGSPGVENSVMLDEIRLEGGVKVTPFDAPDNMEAF